MAEFLKLTSPTEALSRWLSQINPLQNSETILAQHAIGRVTAADIIAPHSLPEYSRSTVDGYAVLAQDTYGASDGLPAYLRIAAEIKMGVLPEEPLIPGTCALIHTGGILPNGATAVVMREYTQAVPVGEIEIFRAVATGENVLKTGEEVAVGDLVIPKGKRLRPVEVGGLMALGITQVEVIQRPTIAIISSGDEVVPADAAKKPGQVRDVNGPALTALVEEAGCVPVFAGIAPDRLDILSSLSEDAFRTSDVLIITAGSSISSRDLTAQVINQLGKPGVVIHGVNIRPGKPTILGVCDGKAVVGLPGNPLSAMVIARLFILPVIDRLLGIQTNTFPVTVKARLSVNLPSQAGREDWVTVKIMKFNGDDEVDFSAEPVFSRSNFIFNLVQADGLVKINEAATGVEAGALVDVWIF